MSNISRLIIGTANFGKEYNGHLVPKNEQKRIWDYAREVGIEWVDTATAYGDIEIPEDFKVITKICKEYPKLDYCKSYSKPCKFREKNKVLLHHIGDLDTDWYNDLYDRASSLPDEPASMSDIFDGLSIYSPVDLLDVPIWQGMIIQLPYNTNWNTIWLEALKNKGTEIHARKIFNGGKLPIRDSLKYALSDIYIDKIVVGIDNVNHLKEIVEIIND